MKSGNPPLPSPLSKKNVQTGLIGYFSGFKVWPGGTLDIILPYMVGTSYHKAKPGRNKLLILGWIIIFRGIFVLELIRA